MALANCKECGRLFNQMHRDICPVCVKEEDEKFTIVREYLQENRKAHTYEVSERTGVEVTIIVKFIREGRLATLSNPNLNFPCDSCGAPITDGRYCKPCKDRLKKDLSQTKSELLNGTTSDSARRDYFYKRER